MPDIVSNWLQNADLRLVEIEESEKIREEAESNRNLNEEIRKTNESERILNEDVRKANEITRKENEVNREKYINDLKQDVADGKFNGKDGEDYFLTEQDEENIADKVKVKLEPDLEANLKTSKDYTDNANIFDIKDVAFNSENGVFTFTRHDDTKIIIDLPVELISKDGYYDEETQELVLILMNNQEIRIPASGLIDDYSTQDSTTIQLSISADNVITASVKGQSIAKIHLTQELQDEINKKVNNDDYATNSKPGLIKTSVSYATGMSADGSLMAGNRNLEAYKSLSNYAFLSKGTNEAIKGDYVKEAVQLDEVKGELHNQGFVKDDDLTPLKKNIDDNTDRIKRLEYDIFESGEAEGTSIHIEDSTYAEAIEIGNEGVSNQKTTKGVQLIDFFSQTSTSHVSVENDKENNKITLSGDGKTGYQSIFYDISIETLKPNDVICFGCEKSTNENSNASPIAQIIENHNDGTSSKYWLLYNFKQDIKYSYILPADISSISRLQFSFYTDNRPLALVEPNTISITKPILYLGDKNNPPEYEEYTGTESSPNPDYPQDIEVIESGTYNLITCAKNLYYSEKDEYVIPAYSRGSWYFVDGARGASGDGFAKKTIFKAKVEKGKQYFFNADISGATTSQLVYSNENSLTNNVNNFVFTASKDDYLTLRMYVPAETECIVKNVYLGLYSDTHDYEPYIESKLPITIPEGEFVAEQDKIKVEWNEEDREYHKCLYKNIGRIFLNNRDWNKDNNGFYTQVNEIKRLSNYSDLIKSNAYRTKVTHSSSGNGISAYYNSQDKYPNQNWIYIYDADKMNMSALEFKEDIDNDSIIAYFPLAEPYKIDLSIADMSKTFTEITNVSSDHPLQPNLHIKYYRDFKKTIKELQGKVQTLEQTSIRDTNIATTTSLGIVKVPDYSGLYVSEQGSLLPHVYTLEQYLRRNNEAAISKGTLEAVLQPIRDKLEELSPSINQESEVNNNDLLQE